MPNGYQNDGEKIQRIEGFFFEGRNRRGRKYQGGTPNKTYNVMDVQNKREVDENGRSKVHMIQWR